MTNTSLSCIQRAKFYLSYASSWHLQWFQSRGIGHVLWQSYIKTYSWHSKATISNHQWRQILLGCCSALVYLQQKNVLHNDINSDNILIERISPLFAEVRAVLIDFNKVCLTCDARRYNLSKQEREYYAEHHPPLKFVTAQSFASDIYSIGRIIMSWPWE